MHILDFDLSDKQVGKSNGSANTNNNNIIIIILFLIVLYINDNNNNNNNKTIITTMVDNSFSFPSRSVNGFSVFRIS